MPCACQFHHPDATHLTSRRALLQGAAAALALGLGGLSRADAETPLGEDFTTEILRLFETAGGASLGQILPFALTPDAQPWQTLPLDVRAGQPVTFLLSGRWYLARAADLWFEPGVVTMARAGDGAIYNPMLNAGTMIADRDGPLSLARSAGEIGPDGNLIIPAEAYLAGDGRVDGVVIAWSGNPVQGLAALMAAAGGGAAEVAGALGLAHRRTSQPEITPEGWVNFYHFGEAGVFRPEGAEMACETHKTVAILMHPVAAALTDGLRLNWDWLVDRLPSALAEDQVTTHDYLSIGVQFDDGQDLTYLWSAALPEGHVFRCPLPTWNAVETHLVQRSGPAGLGDWHGESRDITADYRAHIGGAAQRVVAIWLLGVSVFQRGEGSCRYRNLSLTTPDGDVQIL
ncbi:MAG: hypothetical protein A2092_16695 [Rhodobacteraceae bacterium GWE1_64_9]|jgi:hypothetical protein|nr:MAG: hypothetical protein A2092_16695 [Rhodobacteraceae bacterium GWE1_64_9]OHC47496.1 MAG: hypothetical protein A2X69_04805 [Rhodobacteraceae bacterium GWF1_65_7]